MDLTVITCTQCDFKNALKISKTLLTKDRNLSLYFIISLINFQKNIIKQLFLSITKLIFFFYFKL